MDLRLAVLAVVAFVVVDAKIPVEPKCLINCPYGFAPGSRCVCLTKPGGYRPPFSPCLRKDCGITKRCVVRGNTAFCIPRRPLVPQCRKFCRYGFVPGTRCECKQRPGPSVSPCLQRQCRRNQRCVVRRNRAVCVPRRLARVCYQPKSVGRCRAAIPRFFYNRRTRKCEGFTYGGCGANGNNFKTIEECNRVCPGRLRPIFYKG